MLRSLTSSHALLRTLATLIVALLVLLGGGLLAGPAAQAQTPITTVENGENDTRLELNHNGSLLVPGTFLNDGTENDSIPATGAGTRMMWYPAKAAFRAGRVGETSGFEDTWDAANVGFNSAAFGVDTEASGDQSTAMGVGTVAATDNSLSIGTYNASNSTDDGTLLAVGNGRFSQGVLRRGDALVLDGGGNLAISGAFTDLRGIHAGRFEANKNGADSDPNSYVALVENTNTGDEADGLAIQLGPASEPGNNNNFVTFFDGDGDAVGRIEGDGSGGITTVSGGADYAEELPVQGDASLPESKDLVGVRGGEVSLKTEEADRVMIASTSPIMTGNATPGTSENDARRVPVAFVGQVPTKVRGSVDRGDLIVASGNEDGTGRAVAPETYRRAEHGPIAGQAWESKATSEPGEITVAVGLGRSGAVAERMDTQRERISDLETENEQIKERLAALEQNSSSSLPASLVGPWNLALLLGLGVLTTGFLWRRRGA